jgi:hypothetical protein
MHILCLFKHNWSDWLSDIDARYSSKYCKRCGKRERRKEI